MDCAPELSGQCTRVQRGVAPGGTRTSATLHWGGSSSRVTTWATPRAVPISTCACGKSGNAKEGAGEFDPRVYSLVSPFYERLGGLWRCPRNEIGDMLPGGQKCIHLVAVLLFAVTQCRFKPLQISRRLNTSGNVSRLEGAFSTRGKGKGKGMIRLIQVSLRFISSIVEVIDRRKVRRPRSIDRRWNERNLINEKKLAIQFNSFDKYRQLNAQKDSRSNENLPFYERDKLTANGNLWCFLTMFRPINENIEREWKEKLADNALFDL